MKINSACFHYNLDNVLFTDQELPEYPDNILIQSEKTGYWFVATKKVHTPEVPTPEELVVAYYDIREATGEYICDILFYEKGISGYRFASAARAGTMARLPFEVET